MKINFSFKASYVRKKNTIKFIHHLLRKYELDIHEEESFKDKKSLNS
jgi:hypothetical protein